MVAQRPPAFRGRTTERQVLDRLLEEARRGDSAVLVIRGEAGVGKTALLRHCARQASGFRGISPRKELHDALPARDRHAAPA